MCTLTHNSYFAPSLASNTDIYYDKKTSFPARIPLGYEASNAPNLFLCLSPSPHSSNFMKLMLMMAENGIST